MTETTHNTQRRNLYINVIMSKSLIITNLNFVANDVWCQDFIMGEPVVKRERTTNNVKS